MTIFIAITLHGIRAFLINFLVEGEGWVSVGRQFLQIFRWKTWGATQNLSLWRVSPKGNWMEELVFCAVVIYLLVYYFFYLLFVCVFAFYLLLQSCLLGHASVMWFSVVGRGEGGGYFYGIVWWFWWVSSGLFCSPVCLMQDVMKSLPSFLTYCYYCVYLFILKYTFSV